jgi:hypothetical protein
VAEAELALVAIQVRPGLSVPPAPDLTPAHRAGRLPLLVALNAISPLLLKCAPGATMFRLALALLQTAVLPRMLPPQVALRQSANHRMAPLRGFPAPLPSGAAGVALRGAHHPAARS